MASDDRKRKKKSGAEFKKALKARRKEDETLSLSMSKYFMKQSTTKSDFKNLQLRDEEALTAIDDQQLQDKSPAEKSEIGQTTYENQKDTDQLDNTQQSKFRQGSDCYVDKTYNQVLLTVSEDSLFDHSESKISPSRAESDSDSYDVKVKTSKGCENGDLQEATESYNTDDNDSEYDESSSDDNETEIRQQKTVIEIQNNASTATLALINKEKQTIDPSLITSLKLTKDDKEMLLKLKPCQPEQITLSSKKRQFGKKQRSCTRQAFFHNPQTRRQWISYSVSKDALFCLPCILFSDAALRGENQRHLQGNAFTVTGFCNWKKQFEYIKKHESSENHVNSTVAAALFLQNKSISESLDKQLAVESKLRKAAVTANRSVMNRIVDVIMFLGRQGLALRGHRESLVNDTQNCGNFLELLKLIAEYDECSRNHLEKVKSQQERARPSTTKQINEKPKVRGRGSKVTFLSNDSQNKMIDIIGTAIKKKISSSIDECIAWSLMADTTPDVSRHEQLSICVRIVHSDGTCSEHILNCIKASGTKAEELFNAIKDALMSHGISFEKLVAQTYDGAANMSGCYNGLQAIINREISQKVVYVHCYAHNLNLVLSDSASVALDAATLFDRLEMLYTLFNKSQKIEDVFKKAQEDGNIKYRSMKRVNTVRWSSREMSLSVFLNRYDCIVMTLETVSGNNSFESDQRTKASGILDLIETKQFLATAVLFKEIFAFTGPLSRYLQSTSTDFGEALAMVDNTIAQLENLREHPEYIVQLVEKTFQAEGVQVQWKQNRIQRRRRMDGEEAQDEPAKTPEEHWTRTTFYVVLDTVLNSMKNRFSKNKKLLQSYSLFAPSNFGKLLDTYNTTNHLEPKLEAFCTNYDIDLERCAAELLSFAGAFQKFNYNSTHEGQVPDVDEAELSETDEDTDLADTYRVAEFPKMPSFSDALQLLCHPQYHLLDAYPVLSKVYAIAVAIPISSSTAERTFSALKRVKSRIRSSMVQERLEGLLLMTFERKMCLSIEHDKLIDVFGHSSPELSKALI